MEGEVIAMQDIFVFERTWDRREWQGAGASSAPPGIRPQIRRPAGDRRLPPAPALFESQMEV